MPQPCGCLGPFMSSSEWGFHCQENEIAGGVLTCSSVRDASSARSESILARLPLPFSCQKRIFLVVSDPPQAAASAIHPGQVCRPAHLSPPFPFLAPKHHRVTTLAGGLCFLPTMDSHAQEARVQANCLGFSHFVPSRFLLRSSPR